MSRKRQWIVDPAGVLTGFTGDGGQQHGAHLLEFPERKVRVASQLRSPRSAAGAVKPRGETKGVR